VLAILAGSLPARAARPLPDSGKWDRTFALYARDVAVPWKRISVRLDTYSGAPVDFAAYYVDPADVLVAGSSRSRPIDTSRRTAVARWRFTPPTGLRYTPNDVEVPLQNREGFFVIEARRGDAVQQAWLNLTRVGVLTKESPGGIVLYAADLGTGRALSGMRITYLVGNAFTYARTDAHGIARWSGGQRPRFALAEWGHSDAFVSFLPQPPVPASLVGVRAERANVRAGDRLRVIGFARKRVGTAYRPAAGEVRVALIVRGRVLVSAQAHLDAAGAFGTELALPADAPGGDATVLATLGAASGGAAVHVDSVGDVILAVASTCEPACTANANLPVAITVKRPDGTPVPGRDVHVEVARSPHVPAPGAGSDAAWGTTKILDLQTTSDATGVARVTIPAPTDGLASTYGIVASSGGSTASTRLVTPNARIALDVEPERAQLDLGEPAVIDVRGFDAADGRPAAGLAVNLKLVHGPSEQSQNAILGADGRAQAVFRDVVPGTNLAFAQAAVDGRTALDVSAVTVAPQEQVGTRARRSAEVQIVTDRARYRVGDRVQVDASLSGATGDAFIDFEGTRPLGEQTVNAPGGRARAAFAVPETVGDAAIGVAFVRDGALEYATQRILVDGPGHARATTLAADRPTYAPGSIAHVTIADGDERAGATLAIRLADARAADGASFEDAAAVLSGTGTTTQDSASTDPAWHASVAPRQSTALDLADNERSAPETGLLGAASERSLLWRIDRTDKESFDLPLPETPGSYIVSVLKVSDDGDVGAGTLAIEVR
jgi:hypothetical protein